MMKDLQHLQHLSVTVGKDGKYLGVRCGDAKFISFGYDTPVREILGGILPLCEDSGDSADKGNNGSNDVLAEILCFCADRDSSEVESYYNVIVSVLVRGRYSEDEMEAIICNQLEGSDGSEEHAKEYKAMQAYRSECKARAKDIIGKSKTYGAGS